MGEESTRHIVEMLDPTHQLISHVLDIAHCIVRDGKHCLKNLRVLQNRSLERTIVLESRPFAFSAQMENGIYIPAYSGDEKDNELETVLQFLKTLDDVADFRPVVRKFAGVMRLHKAYTSESLCLSPSPAPAPRGGCEHGDFGSEDGSFQQDSADMADVALELGSLSPKVAYHS